MLGSARQQSTLFASARELAADQVFFDLEDAVAPAAKDEARVNVAEALAVGGLVVRPVRFASTMRPRNGPTVTWST